MIRVLKYITTARRTIDPRLLLDPARLDIVAKTPYARAILDGNTSSWPEEIYEETLRAWNNFYEESPRKTQYIQFKDSFHLIIAAMRDGSFSFRRSPVCVDGQRRLINGSHRVAAAIATDHPILTQYSFKQVAGHWDHNYFRHEATAGGGNGLAEQYIDAMLIEYVLLRPQNLHAFIIFPCAKGNRKRVAEYITNLGIVVDYKSISRDNMNSMTVTAQIYANEWWCNGENMDAWKYKANRCFDGEGPLEVYIVDTELSAEELRAAKNELRSWWKVDNHSIHISDIEEEAITISRMFFNENSRKFLSADSGVEAPNFLRFFDEFLRVLPRDIIERDNYCVDSSSVLAALGVRDAKDLDYLKRGASKLQHHTDNINLHTEEEARFHSADIDTIITDPRKHFYYRGVKFASLEVIESLKANRKDPKDLNDLKLVAAFKKRNPKFGHRLI